MESIISAPQNLPSPALGWFRKFVHSFNHNSNAVSDSSLKRNSSVEKKLQDPTFSASLQQQQLQHHQQHHVNHFGQLQPLFASHPNACAASSALPLCCTQSITPCQHAANYPAKLAALAASGSSFVPPPARVHHDVNIVAPTLYWDYERASLETKRSDPDRYVRSESCIGSGRYSQVFSARDRYTGQRYAIKVIRPGKAKRVRREILILKNLQNGPSIIPFSGFYTDRETSSPALVFDHIDSSANWREMFLSFSSREVKLYMFQMLRGLAFAHSRGIMHRDIKPQNVMYDEAAHKLYIIDWGLAEFYFPCQKYSTRVASRFFKSPEILLGYGAYDYSLDLWSAGCVFAGMIFRTAVFFRGEDDIDQLNKIAQVLGTDDLRSYIRKFDMQQQCNLSPDVDELLADLSYPKIPLGAFVDDENRHLATPDAVELLSQMLVYDHIDRITAEEAMACSYFDEVRDLFSEKN